MLVFLGPVPRAHPQEIDQREYAIKAAFLFHFTQFIEWPEEAMPPPGEPLCIGVLRPNPFDGILNEIVRGEQVKERPIEVRHLDRLDEDAGCHIIFIPNRSGVQRRREAVDRLSGRPVLLVGEHPDFVRRGGSVSLVREEQRVVIVLNREALDEAGLTASSRLLRLARTIGEPEEP